ncbi:hypothetical protein JoomaDRAFT_0526 [Galbibacter orientalis DSM 19592]|uniref:ATP-grasp domain-containing protein n=1 Tax=Galbibacter orientalis DSM 19592 TaxID=926559 RepID=I3C1T1_9FLAO|nr:hypothetical protein [Galbibacter orientalis]EIJ37574.1 hypothetical protein JoomaDRAFT_0526 [Galbibacter orientalis DSM 19592]
MKTILYLTDLYFNANGRNYYEEDLFITSKLREHFNILIGNPQQAIALLDKADLVVFRNTGAVIGYQEYFDRFVDTVKKENTNIFNSFDGKADIKGKQYLLDLMETEYPVIPTVEDISNIDALGNPEKYIVKIKNGADSIGMEILTMKELLKAKPDGKLIQPFLDFEYEVSFYYLDDKFQYALYAPQKDKRWDLQEYDATPGDLEFAKQFIQWNDIKTGITRVDACRMRDGSLLLVELEDLNPFLSIELLPAEKRDVFMENWITVLKKLA